jgi:hypothetical protein
MRWGWRAGKSRVRPNYLSCQQKLAAMFVAEAALMAQVRNQAPMLSWSPGIGAFIFEYPTTTRL